MDIGEYIKQLRTKKGISQEELGKVVGVQRAAVQKWEAGKVQNLKRSTIKKLAEYFNVSPVNFISNDDIMSDNIILSSHEKAVIMAYRNQPAMQEAVDRLLGVPSEPDTSISEEIIDDLVNTVNTIDSNIQKARINKQK